ncbi:MAG: hypothetical protein R3B47_05410 [Bacteroidia bacterium]
MSRSIRNIAIHEPCKAGKEHMSPSERGAMCSLCQKEVIDFRHKSTKEVISYLQKHPKTCGSFWQGQIEFINQRLGQQQPPGPPYSFSNNRALFLASLAAMVFVPVGLVAQEGDESESKTEGITVIFGDICSYEVNDSLLDSLGVLGYVKSPEYEEVRLDGYVSLDYKDYPEDETPALIWREKKRTESLSEAPAPKELPSFWQRMRAVLRRRKDIEEEEE